MISCCLRVNTSGSQSTYFYDSAEPEKMGEVVEILGSCGYQKDIRDLWPGGVQSQRYLCAAAGNLAEELFYGV